MRESTLAKISEDKSPRGEMGQKYLISGRSMAMRLWEEEPTDGAKAPSTRRYETVGYVISGRAELHLDGQVVSLEPGDSWLVPEGAPHSYRILEDFRAVEATCPPAQQHGRDTGH